MFTPAKGLDPLDATSDQAYITKGRCKFEGTKTTPGSYTRSWRPNKVAIAEIEMRKRFNEHICRSVRKLLSERAGGGYDRNSYFTKNLSYGPYRYIKANHPPKTMCVAAVAETIVEALNLYWIETSDKTPFDQLPMRSWNGGSLKDIRPYIFQYDEAKSNGAAYALSLFGIGEELRFEQLEPGDFATLNRVTGSGHSTVFMGFINEDFEDEATYSKAVVGFKYFSAQGKGKPDAGFALRWGIFSPHRPAPVPGKPADYGIIFSRDPKMFCTGRMFAPADWDVQSARMRKRYLEMRSQELLKNTIDLDKLADSAIRLLIELMLDQEMSKELQMNVPEKYETGD